MGFEEWGKVAEAYYFDWEDEDTAVVKSACLAAYQAGQADQREKDARIVNDLFVELGKEATIGHIIKAIRDND